MDIKIIHKEIIVHLFLLFIIAKAMILLIHPEAFRKFRAKTKLVEMILGPAILISGIWAWVTYGYEITTTWIWIKLILLLVGIGITIVAFKKENKVMAVIAILLFIFIYLLALNRVNWGLV